MPLTEADTLGTAQVELPTTTSAIIGIFGRNSLWLSLDRGALRVGTLIAGLLLVKYLGPADYGLYVTVLSVGALGSTMLDIGLTRYTARFVAADQRQAAPVLAVSVAVAASAIALLTVPFLIAVITARWYAACLCLGLIVATTDGVGTLCSTVLTANLNSRAVMVGSLLNTAGVIAVISWVVWHRWSVVGLLAGFLGKSLLVTSVRLWQVRAHWPQWLDWRWHEVRRVVHRAWPFFSYSLTQIGYEQVSIVCFGLVASHQQIGIFGAALALAGVFPQWTYASSEALMPLLTRLFEARRLDDLLLLRQRFVDIFIFVSVPVVALLATFAPELCHVLGARFAASAPVLRVTAFRSAISALDSLLGSAFLIAANLTRERRNAQAIVVPILAVMILTLGHFWGARGAAIALVSADVMLILRYFHIFAKAGLAMRSPAFGSSVLGGIAMALIGIYIPHSMNWGVRCIVVLLVYFCVLFVIAPQRVADTTSTLKDCFSGR